MVKSKQIRDYYLQLLTLVKTEAESNQEILDYYNYLYRHSENFTSDNNVSNTEELREFLRSANRYSDEFSFSNTHYSEIRDITDSLFVFLSQ